MGFSYGTPSGAMDRGRAAQRGDAHCGIWPKNLAKTSILNFFFLWKTNVIFEIYTVFYPGRHVCTIFRVAQFPAKRPQSYLFLSDYFDMFWRATRRSVYFNCAAIKGNFGDMQHILRGIFYTTNHSIFEISFFSDFHRRLKCDVKVNVFFSKFRVRFLFALNCAQAV